MQKEVKIEVNSLGKVFKLPHERSNTVKSALINFWKRDKGYEKFEALKNVSFDIKKGEFFGIVGRNGSGKSTLLKILAGIYEPSVGLVNVIGKLTPFIELGVGFNPELTGRENVFLNGALLGFNRKEMAKMYKNIVSFAELHKFMDQKLKNYSSGMQVRLAFSIAIRARSDILLLDEVLAVGDEAFQRKCFTYFETLKKNKNTVVLVTHDMMSVVRLCDRAMLVEDGEVKLIGKPHEVAAAYSRTNYDNYQVEDDNVGEDKSKYKKSQIDIILSDNNKRKTNKFLTNEEMIINIKWKQKNVGVVGLSIFRQDGEYIFGTNTYLDKVELLPNQQEVAFKVRLNLAPGEYFIQAGLFREKNLGQIDFEEKGPRFAVSSKTTTVKWAGLTRLEHSWDE